MATVQVAIEVPDAACHYTQHTRMISASHNHYLMTAAGNIRSKYLMRRVGDMFEDAGMRSQPA